MISAELAGGDCLNAGCVPSKALLRCAKLIREVRKTAVRDNEYGIRLRSRRGRGEEEGEGGISTHHPGDDDDVQVAVDFPRIMERMRLLRSRIAPVDGHARGTSLGTHVYQGRGAFLAPNTIEVVEHGRRAGDPANPILRFVNAVVATGGRPRVPADVPGLVDAPYTTNVDLFNLDVLPPRMVVLGSGVVAMEMAQAFATFGSDVTVVASGRSGRLLPGADADAVDVLRSALEDDGVTFVGGATVREVTTLRRGGGGGETPLPLMRISLTLNDGGGNIDLECECLLVAMGRTANVESLGLDYANVRYDPSHGILVDEYSRSISNPNVYAVGDCVAHVPRLTHG